MESVELYEGKYTLFSDGRIISHSRKANKYIDSEIKGKVNKAGYRQIILYDLSYKRHFVLVHRLVATYFLENKNNYRVVNHKDGNKLNNEVDNLEWCTDAENQRHARDQLQVYNKKLSLAKAEEIRALYKTKQYKIKDLAEKYKVGETTISYIIQNKRWKV